MRASSQIHKMRPRMFAIFCPQKCLPGWQITMQANVLHAVTGFKCRRHALQGPGSTIPLQGSRSSRGTKTIGEQKVARFDAKGFADRAWGRCSKGLTAPTRWMRPRKRPMRSQHLVIVQIRRPAARSEDRPRKKNPPKLAKRGFLNLPTRAVRWTGISFSSNSAAKTVFLEDLVLAPALRPVETWSPPNCRPPSTPCTHGFS